MSYAPIHFEPLRSRSTAARIGARIDDLVSRVLGPPSVRRIASDLRSGNIGRYVEPGVRQIYLCEGVVYEARASDGWTPRVVR